MPVTPASPPKRMTRARAKATDGNVKIPTTKITTPAAKAAATRQTKKRTRADDEEDELLAEAAANTTKNASATSAPPPAQPDFESVAKSAPKTRGRSNSKTQIAVKQEEEEVAPVKRARGRPRKTTVAEEPVVEAAPTPARSTRTTVAARKPSASRKKVTFQEEEAEKENAPVASKKVQKVVEEPQKETGIRAKPTRRPAAQRGADARTATRSKADIAPPTPASPQKDVKLASVSSRDELDDQDDEPVQHMGATTIPMSPAKLAAQVAATSPARKTQVSPGKEIQLPLRPGTSPAKALGASLLSPAKRPPQSPFKNTMKESPVRAGIAPAPSSTTSKTPAKQSMMSISPKKFTISTVERKRSPPRAMLGAAPSADLKRSLFASPPKRAPSPYKITAAPPSVIKTGQSLMGAMVATAHGTTPRASPIMFSPSRMVATSAFASHKSPAASARVHKMTKEEREQMMRQELLGGPTPFTPYLTKPAKTPKDHRLIYRNELKSAPSPVTPAPQRPTLSRVDSNGSVSGTPRTSAERVVKVATKGAETPRSAVKSRTPVKSTATKPARTSMSSTTATVSARHETPKDARKVLERSTTPEGHPSEAAIRFATPARRDEYRNFADDSDDELQMSTAKLTISPRREHAQTPVAQLARTPASYSRATVASHGKQAGPMTALANKFSNWTSATPDPKVVEQRKIERPLFSQYTKTTKPTTPKTPKTPIAARQSQTPHTQQHGSMTALANKFGDWKGATPDARVVDQRHAQKGVFSPVKPEKASTPRTPAAAKVAQTPKTVKAPMTVVADKFKLPQANEEDFIFAPSPQKFSHFEEQMAILEDASDLEFEESNRRSSFFRASNVSDASQVYGDENESPFDDHEVAVDAGVDYKALAAFHEQLGAITPARLHESQPHIITTVTKVPLKPSHDNGESPLNRPAKLARRSHSLNAPISPQSAKDIRALREIPVRFDSSPIVPHVNVNVPVITANAALEGPSTPRVQPHAQVAPTPIRTPRADLNPRLLAGAVVFVDVHTTEGADASGIFVELLTQMGARCVKQWAWNPDAGSNEGSEVVSTPDASKRVGITHVVFKDGGKRTMEKIRLAKGLVSCVGVAWVLDCERENSWLDESAYAVDTATVPRGGHRRRKSMEPKALTNLNGSLIGTESLLRTSQQGSNTQRHSLMSPSKEFLNLDSPTPLPETPGPGSTVAFTDENVMFSPIAATPEQNGDATMAPSTKIAPATPETYVDPSFYGDSPTTPYFLHPQQIVQRTCPPKQTQQGVLGGHGEEKKAAAVRQRLAMMRRRSLQHAPRVASPLAQVDF